MNIFKKITLILFIACIAVSVHAMEELRTSNQGFSFSYHSRPIARQALNQEKLEELEEMQNAAGRVLLDDQKFRRALTEGPIEMAKYLTTRSVISNGLNFNAPTQVSSLSQTRMQNSRKRIIAMLCSFNSKEFAARLPKDVRDLIVSYLPEEVFCKNHGKFLLRRGVSIKQLIKYCPLHWFKQMYQEIVPKDRAAFVEQFVQYCLDDLREFLMSDSTRKLPLNLLSVRPVNKEVYPLLNPNKVEQFRDIFRRNMQEAFTGQESAPVADRHDAENNNNNNNNE